MKKVLLLSLALFGLNILSAQHTRNFELQVVAEGNFGTPNGDVFNVSNATGSIVASGPLYQTANDPATGFDVLQDFQIVGDKAVLISKSSGYRVVIAEYPSLVHIHTFTNVGAPQTLTEAGENKAYLSSGNPNIIRQIDLSDNTITPVSDPDSAINGYSNYMTYANGYVYVVITSKIIKIDPVTNTVVSTILPNMGSITGIQYDSATQNLWILGKVGNVSGLLKINTADNDSFETPITLSGISNAGYLRLGNNKLYFLSGKNVHAYNLDTPDVTAVPVLYTSTLTGSWDFAYGKAFDVDALSGDFAIGSASGFTANSAYEIVDGSTYEIIATGNVPGCIGANELILKTQEFLGTNKPVADRFTFYPNPASETVIFHTEENQPYTVSLYNQLGALLITSKSNGLDCTINIAAIPAGIYYASLKSILGTSVKKIMVIH